MELEQIGSLRHKHSPPEREKRHENAPSSASNLLMTKSQTLPQKPRVTSQQCRYRNHNTNTQHYHHHHNTHLDRHKHSPSVIACCKKQPAMLKLASMAVRIATILIITLLINNQVSHCDQLAAATSNNIDAINTTSQNQDLKNDRNDDSGLRNNITPSHVISESSNTKESAATNPDHHQHQHHDERQASSEAREPSTNEAQEIKHDTDARKPPNELATQSGRLANESQAMHASDLKIIRNKVSLHGQETRMVMLADLDDGESNLIDSIMAPPGEKRNLNATLEAEATLKSFMNELHFNKTLANKKPTIGGLNETQSYVISVSATRPPEHTIDWKPPPSVDNALNLGPRRQARYRKTQDGIKMARKNVQDLLMTSATKPTMMISESKQVNSTRLSAHYDTVESDASSYHDTEAQSTKRPVLQHGWGKRKQTSKNNNNSSRSISNIQYQGDEPTSNELSAGSSDSFNVGESSSANNVAKQAPINPAARQLRNRSDPSDSSAESNENNNSSNSTSGGSSSDYSSGGEVDSSDPSGDSSSDSSGDDEAAGTSTQSPQLSDDSISADSSAENESTSNSAKPSKEYTMISAHLVPHGRDMGTHMNVSNNNSGNSPRLNWRHTNQHQRHLAVTNWQAIGNDSSDADKTVANINVNGTELNSDSELIGNSYQNERSNGDQVPPIVRTIRYMTPAATSSQLYHNNRSHLAPLIMQSIGQDSSELPLRHAQKPRREAHHKQTIQFVPVQLEANNARDLQASLRTSASRWSTPQLMSSDYLQQNSFSLNNNASAFLPSSSQNNARQPNKLEFYNPRDYQSQSSQTRYFVANADGENYYEPKEQQHHFASGPFERAQQAGSSNNWPSADSVDNYRPYATSRSNNNNNKPDQPYPSDFKSLAFYRENQPSSSSSLNGDDLGTIAPSESWWSPDQQAPTSHRAKVSFGNEQSRFYQPSKSFRPSLRFVDEHMSAGNLDGKSTQQQQRWPEASMIVNSHSDWPPTSLLMEDNSQNQNYHTIKQTPSSTISLTTTATGTTTSAPRWPLSNSHHNPIRKASSQNMLSSSNNVQNLMSAHTGNIRAFAQFPLAQHGTGPFGAYGAQLMAPFGLAPLSTNGHAFITNPKLQNMFRVSSSNMNENTNLDELEQNHNYPEQVASSPASFFYIDQSSHQNPQQHQHHQNQQASLAQFGNQQFLHSDPFAASQMAAIATVPATAFEDPSAGRPPSAAMQPARVQVARPPNVMQQFSVSSNNANSKQQYGTLLLPLSSDPFVGASNLAAWQAAFNAHKIPKFAPPASNSYANMFAHSLHEAAPQVQMMSPSFNNKFVQVQAQPPSSQQQQVVAAALAAATKAAAMSQEPLTIFETQWQPNHQAHSMASKRYQHQQMTLDSFPPPAAFALEPTPINWAQFTRPTPAQFADFASSNINMKPLASTINSTNNKPNSTTSGQKSTQKSKFSPFPTINLPITNARNKFRSRFRLFNSTTTPTSGGNVLKPKMGTDFVSSLGDRRAGYVPIGAPSTNTQQLDLDAESSRGDQFFFIHDTELDSGKENKNKFLLRNSLAHYRVKRGLLNELKSNLISRSTSNNINNNRKAPNSHANKPEDNPKQDALQLQLHYLDSYKDMGQNEPGGGHLLAIESQSNVQFAAPPPSMSVPPQKLPTTIQEQHLKTTINNNNNQNSQPQNVQTKLAIMDMPLVVNPAHLQHFPAAIMQQKHFHPPGSMIIQHNQSNNSPLMMAQMLNLQSRMPQHHQKTAFIPLIDQHNLLDVGPNALLLKAIASSKQEQQPIDLSQFELLPEPSDQFNSINSNYFNGQADGLSLSNSMRVPTFMSMNEPARPESSQTTIQSSNNNVNANYNQVPNDNNNGQQQQHHHHHHHHHHEYQPMASQQQQASFTYNPIEPDATLEPPANDPSSTPIAGGANKQKSLVKKPRERIKSLLKSSRRPFDKLGARFRNPLSSSKEHNQTAINSNGMAAAASSPSASYSAFPIGQQQANSLQALARNFNNVLSPAMMAQMDATYNQRIPLVGGASSLDNFNRFAKPLKQWFQMQQPHQQAPMALNPFMLNNAKQHQTFAQQQTFFPALASPPSNVFNSRQELHYGPAGFLQQSPASPVHQQHVQRRPPSWQSLMQLAAAAHLAHSGANARQQLPHSPLSPMQRFLNAQNLPRRILGSNQPDSNQLINSMKHRVDLGGGGAKATNYNVQAVQEMMKQHQKLRDLNEKLINMNLTSSMKRISEVGAPLWLHNSHAPFLSAQWASHVINPNQFRGAATTPSRHFKMYTRKPDNLMFLGNDSNKLDRSNNNNNTSFSANENVFTRYNANQTSDNNSQSLQGDLSTSTSQLVHHKTASELQQQQQYEFIPVESAALEPNDSLASSFARQQSPELIASLEAASQAMIESAESADSLSDPAAAASLQQQLSGIVADSRIEHQEQQTLNQDPADNLNGSPDQFVIQPATFLTPASNNLQQQQQFQGMSNHQASNFLQLASRQPKLTKKLIPSINSMATKFRQHLYQTFRLNGPLAPKWQSNFNQHQQQPQFTINNQQQQHQQLMSQQQPIDLAAMQPAAVALKQQQQHQHQFNIQPDPSSSIQDQVQLQMEQQPQEHTQFSISDGTSNGNFEQNQMQQMLQDNLLNTSAPMRLPAGSSMSVSSMHRGNSFPKVNSKSILTSQIIQAETGIPTPNENNLSKFRTDQSLFSNNSTGGQSDVALTNEINSPSNNNNADESSLFDSNQDQASFNDNHLIFSGNNSRHQQQQKKQLQHALKGAQLTADISGNMLTSDGNYAQEEPQQAAPMTSARPSMQQQHQQQHHHQSNNFHSRYQQPKRVIASNTYSDGIDGAEKSPLESQIVGAEQNYTIHHHHVFASDNNYPLSSNNTHLIPISQIHRNFTRQANQDDQISFMQQVENQVEQHQQHENEAANFDAEQQRQIQNQQQQQDEIRYEFERLNHANDSIIANNSTRNNKSQGVKRQQSRQRFVVVPSENNNDQQTSLNEFRSDYQVIKPPSTSKYSPQQYKQAPVVQQQVVYQFVDSNGKPLKTATMQDANSSAANNEAGMNQQQPVESQLDYGASDGESGEDEQQEQANGQRQQFVYEPGSGSTKSAGTSREPNIVYGHHLQQQQQHQQHQDIESSNELDSANQQQQQIEQDQQQQQIIYEEQPSGISSSESNGDSSGPSDLQQQLEEQQQQQIMIEQQQPPPAIGQKEIHMTFQAKPHLRQIHIQAQAMQTQAPRQQQAQKQYILVAKPQQQQVNSFRPTGGQQSTRPTSRSKTSQIIYAPASSQIRSHKTNHSQLITGRPQQQYLLVDQPVVVGNQEQQPEFSQKNYSTLNSQAQMQFILGNKQQHTITTGKQATDPQDQQPVIFVSASPQKVVQLIAKRPTSSRWQTIKQQQQSGEPEEHQQASSSSTLMISQLGRNRLANHTNQAKSHYNPTANATAGSSLSLLIANSTTSTPRPTIYNYQNTMMSMRKRGEHSDFLSNNTDSSSGDNNATQSTLTRDQLLILSSSISTTKQPKARIRWQGASGVGKGLSGRANQQQLDSLSSAETNRRDQKHAWIVGSMTHQAYSSNQNNSQNNSTKSAGEILADLIKNSSSMANNSSSSNNNNNKESPVTLARGLNKNHMDDSVNSSSSTQQATSLIPPTPPTTTQTPLRAQTISSYQQLDEGQQQQSFGSAPSTGANVGPHTWRLTSSQATPSNNKSLKSNKLNQTSALGTNHLEPGPFQTFKSAFKYQPNGVDQARKHQQQQATTTTPSTAQDSRTASTSFRLAGPSTPSSASHQQAQQIPQPATQMSNGSGAAIGPSDINQNENNINGLQTESSFVSVAYSSESPQSTMATTPITPTQTDQIQTGTTTTTTSTSSTTNAPATITLAGPQTDPNQELEKSSTSSDQQQQDRDSQEHDSDTSSNSGELDLDLTRPIPGDFALPTTTHRNHNYKQTGQARM